MRLLPTFGLQLGHHRHCLPEADHPFGSGCGVLALVHTKRQIEPPAYAWPWGDDLALLPTGGLAHRSGMSANASRVAGVVDATVSQHCSLRKLPRRGMWRWRGRRTVGLGGRTDVVSDSLLSAEVAARRL